MPAPLRHRIRTLVQHRLRSLNGPAPLADYADYDEYWESRDAFDGPMRRWVIAADLIPDGASVLDFGCGSGDFLAHLRSVRPAVDATGLDVAKQAVELTRSKGFEATTIDILTDEIDGTYDVVTSFEVLEHIADAEVALRKLARAAKGRIIVSIPNVGAINCRLRLAMFGRFPTTRCVFHVKEHVRHWTPIDFREWVASEDLRVVSAQGDWGIKGTPWRRFPALFCRGMIYELAPAA